MTNEEALQQRTCPLCRKRIADECPNTLEHVTAQRDHYWDCLGRYERLTARSDHQLNLLRSRLEYMRSHAVGSLWDMAYVSYLASSALIEAE